MRGFGQCFISGRYDAFVRVGRFAVVRVAGDKNVPAAFYFDADEIRSAQLADGQVDEYEL